MNGGPMKRRYLGDAVAFRPMECHKRVAAARVYLEAWLLETMATPALATR